MGWISAIVTQDPNTTWVWTISNFTAEPGSVATVAISEGLGTTVTTISTGNHQPTLAEQQQNVYKSYMTVVNNPNDFPASFFIAGVGS